MSDGEVFADYARYYDLLYRDKDYAAEADYVHALVQRWRPGAKTILELGSGTGKHAALMAAHGYVVHGVERSDQMLECAQRLVSTRPGTDAAWSVPTFVRGDIRTVRLDLAVSAVISLFHVISYQVSNDDVIGTLTTAREHLDAGGVFVFDVWYGPAVLTDRPAVRVKRMSDDRIEVTRLAEPVMHPNENVVAVNYHVFIRDKQTGHVVETHETHPMRYLFLPEVQFLATACGFRLEHAEEWLTGRPLGCDTWSACFVLRAG